MPSSFYCEKCNKTNVYSGVACFICNPIKANDRGGGILKRDAKFGDEFLDWLFAEHYEWLATENWEEVVENYFKNLNKIINNVTFKKDE